MFLPTPNLPLFGVASEKTGYPFGPHVKLMILTAQRRNEVSTLRWADLNLEHRTWIQPAASNKSGRTHIVPLSDLSLETIRSMPRVHDELVFPARGKNNPVSGYSKWKRKLDQISGVNDWTLHDLRRTAATGMAQLKVPLHVIELVLNHRSKSLSGVAGIYNRHEYFDEQRDALDRWARHVENLVLESPERRSRGSRGVSKFAGQASFHGICIIAPKIIVPDGGLDTLRAQTPARISFSSQHNHETGGSVIQNKESFFNELPFKYLFIAEH